MFGRHKKQPTAEEEQAERRGIALTLCRHMRRKRISRRQVLCYINWVQCMRQEEIAEVFGITQQGVAKHLFRLKEKWPDLFLFPQSKPHQYDPERDDHRVIYQF